VDENVWPLCVCSVGGTQGGSFHCARFAGLSRRASWPGQLRELELRKAESKQLMVLNSTGCQGLPTVN
jgi:hypothetical protein